MRRKWPLLLIIILGVTVYFNTLTNQFLLDDPSQATKNPLTKSVENIPLLFLGSTFAGGAHLEGVYYKPLMTSSFAVINTLFGENPLPFHILQISLHIINAILVFYLFKHFLAEKLALFLSLVFLVHPINIDAVGYISALQDPLFFIFGTSALLIILPAQIKWSRYLIFVLLILGSLLSKETGLLFLIIGAVYRLIFFPNKKTNIKHLAITLSILAFYLVIRHFTVGSPISNDKVYPISRLTLWERILTTPKIFFTYLKDFFYPKDLAVAQHWVVKQLSWSSFYLPLIMGGTFLTALLITLHQLWRKHQPQAKVFFFFLVWFLAGMGLHMNLLPLDVTVAERWFYFPVVGLLGMLGIIYQVFIPPKLPTTNYPLLIPLIILLSLSVRTIVRNLDWKDGLTLAKHDINVTTDSFPLENNLGFELINANQYDEALIHVQRSTQLGPHWWLNWNNLGVIYRHKAQVENNPDYYKKAQDSFRQAIANTHTFYMPYENLAELLLFYSSPGEAIQFLADTSSKLPPNSRLLFLASIAYYQLGNKQAASETAYGAYSLDNTNQLAYQLYQAIQTGQTVQLQSPTY